jgi:hypothetical protein
MAHILEPTHSVFTLCENASQEHIYPYSHTAIEEINYGLRRAHECIITQNFKGNKVKKHFGRTVFAWLFIHSQ